MASKTTISRHIDLDWFRDLIIQISLTNTSGWWLYHSRANQFIHVAITFSPSVLLKYISHRWRSCAPLYHNTAHIVLRYWYLWQPSSVGHVTHLHARPPSIYENNIECQLYNPLTMNSWWYRRPLSSQPTLPVITNMPSMNLIKHQNEVHIHKCKSPKPHDFIRN